jgi:hypothetical protein
MKHTHQFFTPLLIALFIASIFISPAQAQTGPTEEPVCRDAAGGVIPCPPTPEPESPTSIPTSAPVNPTSMPASPTNTPLPLINPTLPTATPQSEFAISPPSSETKVDVKQCGWRDPDCINDFVIKCITGGGQVLSNPAGPYISMICLTDGPGAGDPTAGVESKTCSLYDAACYGLFMLQCLDNFGSYHESWNIGSKTIDVICITADIVPSGSASLPTQQPELISGQTEEPGTGKAEWSGVCKDTTCISQFTNGCESVGGTVDIGEIKEGTVPLTCKVPMGEYEPDMAIAAAPTEEPDAGDPTAGVESKTCPLSDGFCHGNFMVQCIKDGGAYGQAVDVKSETIIGFCFTPDVAPFAPPAPGPTPSSGFPPGGWLPWITGFSGLLIGLLLPAVQKVREAATRAGQTREDDLLNKEDDSNTEPEQAGIPNLTDKPDGGSTGHKDWIRVESFSDHPDSGASSGAMPQTKEHVLLNKDDEPPVAEKPTIKNEDDDPQEAKKIFLGGLSAQPEPPQPQTREHILLANQDADAPKDAT